MNLVGRVGFPAREPALALGFEASPFRRRGRSSFTRLASVALESVGWSGGTKIPSSRKDFTFDMRMREEAEGEIRMIGSGRAWEELDLRDDDIERPADGAGMVPLLPGLALGWPGRLRLRSRNNSALLRTCEKSLEVD